MRRAAFLSLLLAALVVGFVPAGADRPETMSTFPVDETNVLAHCAGFDLVEHMAGSMTVTIWWAKDGAPRRIKLDAHGVHELRNTATGFQVDDGYNRSFITDLDKGRTHVTGPAYTVTVPGHGAVLFETGTMIVQDGAVSHVSGQHDAAGGFDHLCSVFA